MSRCVAGLLLTGLLECLQDGADVACWPVPGGSGSAGGGAGLPAGSRGRVAGCCQPDVVGGGGEPGGDGASG